jgi:osmoprotectant transport system permease protein
VTDLVDGTAATPSGVEAATVPDATEGPGPDRSAPVHLRRWIAGGLALAALVVFAIWAKGRIDGLHGPGSPTAIVRWEYVFKRPETPGELRAMTIEHLKLTVIPVLLGLVISSLLALVVRKVRFALGPITVFTSFLYTIPSFALFAVLVSYVSNFAAAVIALTSYTLLILVRNIVAGLASVPRHVLDAADGLGMSPAKRLFSVELPLALPVIMTGIRVATVTTVGLVAISSIIQLGGLGSLIFDGYQRRYNTLIVLGTVLSVALAVALDFALDRFTRLVTPWDRRGAR